MPTVSVDLELDTFFGQMGSGGGTVALGLYFGWRALIPVVLLPLT